MDKQTADLIGVAVVLGVNFGVPLLLLGLGYWIGHSREKGHYRSIKAREARYLKLPVSGLKPGKAQLKDRRGVLVHGSVVVANDYFKRFAAGLRNIFGGRVRSYEALVDRARREAVLRMLREAEKLKAVELCNLRIETSTIGSSTARNRSAGSVEAFAYATALIPR